MSKLGKLLKTYAIESDLVDHDESHVGATELSYVSDETTTELEEVVDKVGEEVQKAVDDGDAVKALEKGIESLESHLADLSALTQSTVPVASFEAAIIFASPVVSLEALGIPKVLYPELLSDGGLSHLSNESAEENVDEETVEVQKGKVAKVIDRLKSILSAAAGGLSKAVEAAAKLFADGGTKLIDSAKKLEDKAEGENASRNIKGQFGILNGNASASVSSATKAVSAASNIISKLEAGVSILESTITEDTIDAARVAKSVTSLSSVGEEIKINDTVVVNADGTGGEKLKNDTVEMEALTSSEVASLATGIRGLGEVMADVNKRTKKLIDKTKEINKASNKNKNLKNAEDVNIKEIDEVFRNAISRVKLLNSTVMSGALDVGTAAYKLGVASNSVKAPKGE